VLVSLAPIVDYQKCACVCVCVCACVCVCVCVWCACAHMLENLFVCSKYVCIVSVGVCMCGCKHAHVCIRVAKFIYFTL